MSRYRRSRGQIGAGSNTAWNDLLSNGMIVFAVLMLLILAMVEEEKTEDAQVASPGNVVVEISWDPQRDVDLDLWVQGPGDKPVGYSSREGRVFNLLRDDLGKYNDSSEVNMENAYSRGIVKGEYCLNVHYFNGRGNRGPIECKVRVLVAKTGDGSKAAADEILITDLELKLGQEQTAFRFELTESGELVDDSVHHRFKPLRSASRGGFGMRR